MSFTFCQDADMHALANDVTQTRVLLSKWNSTGVLGSACITCDATTVVYIIDVHCVEVRKWAAYRRPFEISIDMSGKGAKHVLMPCHKEVTPEAVPTIPFYCLTPFERVDDTGTVACVQTASIWFDVQLVRCVWQPDSLAAQTQWRITLCGTPSVRLDRHTLLRVCVNRSLNDDGRATAVRVCLPARAHLRRLCAALATATNECNALTAAQQLITAFFYCARVCAPCPDWLTSAEVLAIHHHKMTPVLADVPLEWRHTMFESAWLACASAIGMDARQLPLCKRLLPCDVQQVTRLLDTLATHVAHYEAAIGHVPLVMSDDGTASQWLAQMHETGRTLCAQLAD